MGEAAAEAARGKTTGEHDLASVSRALEALRVAWGDAYLTGCDAKGWWAARQGVIGEFFRADSPGELDKKIQAHFGAWPS